MSEKEDFKIGIKVACYVEQGSYYKHWRDSETIVGETKTLWITDKGSRFFKEDGRLYGSCGDPYTRIRYHVWTNEMEIRKQQLLLKRNLERDIVEALSNHRFSVTQLQYIKSMINT